MKGYYDRAEPVPDDTIVRLVLPRVRPTRGCILDGFPGSAVQARRAAHAHYGYLDLLDPGGE